MNGTVGTVQAAGLVAGREIRQQVRSKAFLISTVGLLVIVLVGIVAGSLLAGRTPGTVQVAVVPATQAQTAAIPHVEVVEADDEAAARALVEDGSVQAAVLPGSVDSPPVVVANESAPGLLVDGLTVAPTVELLEPPVAGEGVRYLVSFGFGLVFMMSAITYGSTIAQNTVTEKQTRIVEILLSAVPARALLAGKILGNSVLALGQTAAVAATVVIGLSVTGQDDVLGLIGAPVAWFVLFFALGFVLLASVFAASASLVSRVEDTGPVLTPVIYLTMIPYFVVVIWGDNPAVMTAMSYVPFSAPVGMPVRLFLGTAAWWEPLVSLAVLVASTLAVIALAGRVYSRSVLQTGPRVRLRDALSARSRG